MQLGLVGTSEIQKSLPGSALDPILLRSCRAMSFAMFRSLVVTEP